MGDFAVDKRKQRITKKLPNGDEVIALAVDWKKSKAAGKKIYHLNSHTEGYRFKWKWFSKTARFKSPEIWNFKPYRITSRLLHHFLTKGENQQKYKEWSLIK